MRRALWVGIFAIAGFLLISGCGPCGANNLCKKNREYLPTLLTRMSPEEVKFFMKRGPCKKEFYVGKNGEDIVVFYYLTNLQDEKSEITDKNLTPIFFVNYELRGWGSSYWETILTKHEPAL